MDSFTYNVVSERQRFVARTVPERFGSKVCRFLDQSGGPKLERADENRNGKWMSQCAEKGFLVALVFHRCVLLCVPPSVFVCSLTPL